VSCDGGFAPAAAVALGSASGQVDAVTELGIEATGASFSLGAFLDMRARTRRAVHAIAERVEVGMAEEDARAAARGLLGELGMRRGWHHVIVRIGPNTTKSFHAPSEKGVSLGADDIFFVDIGPISNGMEGDAGETFVVGDDPEHHRAHADVRAIWDDVRHAWLTSRLSGRDLYAHAVDVTRARGWALNLDLSGHRLSDFPHAAAYDGPMAEVDIVPASGLWVLEIAIIHPSGAFGAFYEDLLLLEDQRLGEMPAPDTGRS
jgi:methionyl aminopeptidase